MEDEKKIEIKEQKAEEIQKNVLENGTYSIYGPDNGEIMIDKIELHSGSGAKRIWKVEKFSKKEIVLKVEKFA